MTSYRGPYGPEHGHDKSLAISLDTDDAEKPAASGDGFKPTRGVPLLPFILLRLGYHLCLFFVNIPDENFWKSAGP